MVQLSPIVPISSERIRRMVSFSSGGVWFSRKHRPSARSRITRSSALPRMNSSPARVFSISVIRSPF